MLEVYKLYWGKTHIGYIKHNTETDKFSAELLTVKSMFPRRLFGFVDKPVVVGDKRVRHYIETSVAPRNRENIHAILKLCGLRGYDAWGIFKFYDGVNGKDSCRIERLSTNRVQD